MILAGLGSGSSPVQQQGNRDAAGFLDLSEGRVRGEGLVEYDPIPKSSVMGAREPMLGGQVVEVVVVPMGPGFRRRVQTGGMDSLG